jgi:osmoprotectant transport system permease protein
MRVLQDAWRYLTDAGSWTGDGGMLELLAQQLLLTAGALALALVLGLPLALWLGHLGRGGFLAVNVSNIGRAIPTFALLALLVTADPWGWTGGHFPGTATLGPFGRGGAATLVALALFALPPIITNAYTAVREVPEDVRAAARGMGMSGAQVFRRAEWPLALPLVASGVRLALVQVGAGAGDHRRLLPYAVRQGHRRRDRGRRGRAGARAHGGVGAAGRHAAGDARGARVRRTDG